jgi:lipopolysaccharide export system permease protein
LILRRYYIKEFLRIFAITGLGLAAVMSAIELIRHLDEFMLHGPTAWELLRFAALLFPRYFLYLMPVAALLCSLYTVGTASRRGEIVAVMASGGRVKRLLVPFVLMGAGLSLMGFVLEEMVVPGCSESARELRGSIRGIPATSTFQSDGAIWLRAEDGSLVKIDFYLEEQGSFKGMSIFRVSGGLLNEIIQAEEARYLPAEKSWVLGGVDIYGLQSGEIQSMDEMRYLRLGSPGILEEEARKPYELGIFELSRYLKRLKQAGFKNLRLSVEMQSKLSYPLVSLFMVVLGVSVAARRTLGGLVATATGLLISVAYWFGYTMMLSLGYTGIVPPVVSAWLLPIMFGAASVFLYSKIPE